MKKTKTIKGVFLYSQTIKMNMRKTARMAKRRGGITKEWKNSEGVKEMVTAVIDESHDWSMSHPSVHFTAQDHTHTDTYAQTHTHSLSL